MFQKLDAVVQKNASDNKTALANWIQQYTPDQIREANAARKRLRRLTGRPRIWAAIPDARIPKQPNGAWIQFVTKQTTGSHPGEESKTQNQSVKEAATKWKNMSAAERKVGLLGTCNECAVC